MKTLVHKSLAALAQGVAKDPGREVLWGIHATLSGNMARYEVTDRHQAIRVDTAPLSVDEWPAVGGEISSDETQRAIVPADMWKKALSHKHKGARSFPILNQALLALSKDVVALVTTNLEQTQVETAKPLEGFFPDLNRVAPEGEPIAEVEFDARLLCRVLDTLQEIIGNGKTAAPVRMKICEGRDAPITLEGGNVDRALRVTAWVMPMIAGSATVSKLTPDEVKND